MTPQKTVLLIDDHALTYEGVAAVLARAPDLRLLAHLADPTRAAEVAVRERPDIALVDICMPVVNGLQVAMEIARVVPACLVIALSAYDDEFLVDQMIESGARGYVLKTQAGAELLDAIRTVLAGRLYFKHVSRGLTGSEKRTLSPREQQLLQLIAESKTTAEIAELLGLSVKTVETYRRRVMAKLRVDSAAQLVRAAVVLGRGA